MTPPDLHRGGVLRDEGQEDGGGDGQGTHKEDEALVDVGEMVDETMI